MTIYFVSSEIGSNTNKGTLDTAPLATLQAAEGLVNAGDTVEVMNGTYTGSPGGNLLQITTSGTAVAPITFEAAIDISDWSSDPLAGIQLPDYYYSTSGAVMAALTSDGQGGTVLPLPGTNGAIDFRATPSGALSQGEFIISNL